MILFHLKAIFSQSNRCNQANACHLRLYSDHWHFSATSSYPSPPPFVLSSFFQQQQHLLLIYDENTKADFSPKKYESKSENKLCGCLHAPANSLIWRSQKMCQNKRSILYMCACLMQFNFKFQLMLWFSLRVMNCLASKKWDIVILILAWVQRLITCFEVT